MAAVPPAVVLHQAEAHLRQLHPNLTRRNVIWIRMRAVGGKGLSHETAFSYRFINGNDIQWTGLTSRLWACKLKWNLRVI